MAKSSYFSNFPVIEYNGKQCVDITERAVFANTSLNDPNLFYPYDLSTDERAEQFANRYYKDSYKDWIIYLSNQFVDPYYEWYMNDDSFQKFIIKKYGSQEIAQNKIVYFQNNWYLSGDISLSQYNSLPYTLYKYWQPNYGNNNKIISYSRMKSNDTVSTNYIISINGVLSNNFIRNEICKFTIPDRSSIYRGQVMSVVNNNVYIQHLMLDSKLSSNQTSLSITGTESNTTSSFSSYNIVSSVLNPEEVNYWSAVTYMDMETAKNESNKTIQVLDSNYAITAANDLNQILQNKKIVF